MKGDYLEALVKTEAQQREYAHGTEYQLDMYGRVTVNEVNHQKALALEDKEYAKIRPLCSNKMMQSDIRRLSGLQIERKPMPAVLIKPKVIVAPKKQGIKKRSMEGMNNRAIRDQYRLQEYKIKTGWNIKQTLLANLPSIVWYQP